MVGSLSIHSGCFYDNEVDLYGDIGCDTVGVTYSGVVLPIIENVCYGCHDAENNSGGITLEGYDELLPYVQDGSLLGSIKREDGYSPMPQNQGPLPDCNIQKIEVWILDGAQDN